MAWHPLTRMHFPKQPSILGMLLCSCTAVWAAIAFLTLSDPSNTNAPSTLK